MADAAARLVPGPGETVAGPYRAMRFDRWLDGLAELAGTYAGRPRIIAVDGRGGAGKSALTRRITDAVDGAAVVHTDDLAWHYSIFGWDELLLDRFLLPLRRGEAVDVRPPGWDTHGRPGSVVVPAGCSTVVVEGTGALRDTTASAYDASVWVQSDYRAASSRAIDRDVELGVNGDRVAATRFWDHWQLEEIPFYREQRPWDRADTVVAGTDVIALGPDEIAVARPPRNR